MQKIIMNPYANLYKSPTNVFLWAEGFSLTDTKWDNASLHCLKVIWALFYSWVKEI